VIPSAQIQSAIGFTGGFTGGFTAPAVCEEVLREFVACGRFVAGFDCVFDGVFEAGDDCACECDASHTTLTTFSNNTQINLILRLLTTALSIPFGIEISIACGRRSKSFHFNARGKVTLSFSHHFDLTEVNLWCASERVRFEIK